MPIDDLSEPLRFRLPLEHLAEAELVVALWLKFSVVGSDELSFEHNAPA